MSWSRLLSLTLGIALAGVIRYYWARYQTWKAARTEIPAYRNWRGHYVPDLMVKRFQQVGWAFFAAVLMFGMFSGYVIMSQ